MRFFAVSTIRIIVILRTVKPFLAFYAFSIIAVLSAVIAGSMRYFMQLFSAAVSVPMTGLCALCLFSFSAASLLPSGRSERAIDLLLYIDD